MKRITLLIAVILLGLTSVQAKKAPVAEQDTTVKVSKAKQNWTKFVTFADNFYMRNIDTNYIVLPKYRWRITYNSEASGVHTFLVAHDVPYYGNIDAQMHSNVTPKMGLQIAFRNLSAGYAVDLFKGYSNFSFSAIQNAFGIDILRRKTSYAHGSIDLSGLNKRTEIDAGDVDVTTLFVSGYFAFNRKKFSMPAAFKQSYIQRKSAGSVLAHLDFRYAGLEFDDENYIAQAGGVRELELYQLAIGVGYGYNYTPNKGKFLLHLSATPMLTVFNHMLMTGDSRMFWHNDKDDYNLVFSRKLKGRFPVFFTGNAKIALVWNINDRFVLAATCVANNIRFRARDKMFEIDRDDLDLNYNTVIDSYIMTWDWKANIYFGVRF